MSLAESISDAFDAIADALPEVGQTVSWSGTRRANGVVRQLSFPLKVIATQNDDEAMPPDATGPSVVRSWRIRILEAEWPDATPPQIGDEVLFEDGERLSVKNVQPRKGMFYTLEARSC